MRLTRREWLVGAGGLLSSTCGLAPLLAGIGSGGEVVAFGGAAFGTYWRVALPRGADQRTIRRHVEEILASVDRSMSPFRAGTEISRFNAMESDRLFPASLQFQAVVSESLRIAELTGGAFDPTVGPLVNQYGFGPIRGETRARFSDITTGSAVIGKTRRDVTLDLCGIAKGYALDRIVQGLEALGVKHFIAEIGGEVAARGIHPQGRPWQVAIERPAVSTDNVQRVVRLEGCAIATSGDSANGYTFAGRRYCHIVDARHGAPVDNGIASVSVIARTAVEADALATALMVLGKTKGSAFASRHGVPALMLIRDGDRIEDLALAGFGDFILG